MTRNSKVSNAAIFTVLLLIPSRLLFSQQSNFQTLFLAPAAIRLTNPIVVSSGISASIIKSEDLPYLKELAKEAKPQLASFQPTPSDLLIQQAEERFRAGKKFYQDRDFDRARTEFDAAIQTMLKASPNPTDRRLFESKLEEMVDSIHYDDISGFGDLVLDEVPGFDKAPLDDIVTTTFPIDPRIKDKVQSEVKLTTSALPLIVNDTVLSYINYFNGRGHRTMEVGLERAGKYRAMISRILSEEGIPQELIHLAQAESGFLPRAVSRAAAEGMWQFVKFRGNQYGLMQTPYSDERLDPEKATRAAAHHLHDLYNEFGDWYLAIAAYNCGPGAIEKAVERTGYADFWELRARGVLPSETTNYVPIILAMTIMAKNAPEYGLDHITPESPIEYETITTASPTSLALVSDLTDTPLPELVQLNPALLRNIAPGNFEVRVPRGMAHEVSAALDLIPAERRASWRMHRVEQGESLSSVARLFSLPASQIASANDLKDEPAPGDRIMIPVSYREATNSPQTSSVHTAKAPASRASKGKRASAGGSLTATRKAPAKTLTFTVSAHHPLHPAAGTIAQLKSQNHSLNP
jgi:membrane-bound lytic murein transglycosylase D